MGYQVAQFTPLILLALVVVYAWFWIKQFVWLMSMDDKNFPGSYDKIVWGGLFVFLFPIAPIAFAIWRGAQRELKR